MVTYYLNRASTEEFAEKYGEDWCVGRIDVMDIEDQPHGLEYQVPIMERKCWLQFADLLDRLETEKILSYQQLIGLYLQKHGEVMWLKK